MLQWLFYPQNKRIPRHLEDVIDRFQDQYEKIKSPTNNFQSNEVLAYLRLGLEELGFKVEKGKKKSEIIEVPVLFGRNGKLIKYFQVDAYNLETQTVIEVEAGRAVANNQFLKDLFEACLMTDSMIIKCKFIVRISRISSILIPLKYLKR